MDIPAKKQQHTSSNRCHQKFKAERQDNKTILEPIVFSFTENLPQKSERGQTSRSSEQDKQTESSSVYGRGLVLTGGEWETMGEVTICNLGPLKDEEIQKREKSGNG